MLSDRRRRILNALINEYVSTAMPVSSKALVGNYGLGVSSATVRNELFVLEEDGYVVSPHVSSGRIPTDSGYRNFVDQLLSEKTSLDEQLESKTSNYGSDSFSELRASAAELDSLLKETSRVLNKFTDCLAVIVAPRLNKLALKQISLVPTDEHHVIVVMVVKDGRVLNKTVELKTAFSQEEIHVLEHLLNEQYETRGSFDPLVSEQNEDQNQETRLYERLRGFLGNESCHEALATLIDAIDESLIEGEKERIHINGLEALFSKPELQKVSLTMGFARLLDDDLRVFRLLGDFMTEDGIAARIGHENADDDMNDVSIVASKYGENTHEGVVAVVGPTRMDYTKVIDAVKNVSSFLDEATGKIERDEGE